MSTRATIVSGDDFHIFVDLMDEAPNPVYLTFDETHSSSVINNNGRTAVAVSIPADMWQRVVGALVKHHLRVMPEKEWQAVMAGGVCLKCGRSREDYEAAGSLNGCRKGGEHEWGVPEVPKVADGLDLAIGPEEDLDDGPHCEKPSKKKKKKKKKK